MGVSMDIYLFSILLFITTILLLLFFFKKQIIIGIFTGILFIMLGVLGWGGLSYVSSTTITGTSGNYTVENHYSEWSNAVAGDFTDNQLVGTSFVLLGLFLLIVSGAMTFSEKKVMDLGDDNGGGEE